MSVNINNIFKILFLLFLIFIFSPKSYAADFQTNYKIDYFLDENNGNPQTKVKLRIDIKSLIPGQYISKFSISFPKYFKIDNPTALSNEPITPDIVSTDLATTIKLDLPQPKNNDDITTIYMDFLQENLFKINGNIWEVILPTILIEKGNDYQISLHLPEATDKKISISKPKPTLNEGKTVTWTNPDTKTIYATFGNKQIYKLHLLYHLQNTQIRRVFTDVAFPPDSLYQKIFINSISVKPDKVFTDSDGNFIGRYILNPTEKKDIVFDGTAELLTLPRSEIKYYNLQQLTAQKKYLLEKNKYWSVNLQTNLTDTQDIFSYVSSSLSYDTHHFDKKTKRLGAMEALKHPELAVCTEYTDLFVALTRQKGIYSREVEGFGFANDSEIRPISLNSDILHAWPEYFDSNLSEWVPVDPTWQSTSGINYFSSFDLNHIAFAFHGKDPEYPFPAGMYKVTNTKDVKVTASSSIPKEKVEVKVISFPVDEHIFGEREYSAKLSLENKGNTYLWNIPIKVSTPLIMSDKELLVNSLAPMEKKDITIKYRTPKVYSTQPVDISFLINNSVNYSVTTALMPFYFDIALKTGIVIIGLFILLFVLPYIFRNVLRVIRKPKI